jgi:hypothetical protein
VLDIGGCDRITDAGVGKVATACRRLVRWGLFECPRVTHAAVLNIARNQPDLEWLVVGREEEAHGRVDPTAPSPLDQAAVAALATQCTKLAVLQIKAVPTALENGGLASLLQHTPQTLTRLELANCGVPDTIGALLEPLATTLCDLSLAGNPKLTDDAVISLTASCSLVTALDVSGCKELTDRVITAGLAAHGHRFVRVGLARCSHISDVGLHALAAAGNRIRRLDLAFCDHVTDAGLASVARQCSELRYLDVTFCIQLTAAAVVVIGEHARRLRSLSLRGCPAIADAGLGALAKGCPMLELLNVWECPLVTDIGLGQVLRRCPLLWSLSICGCALVTDVTADLVAALGSSALTDVSHTDAGFTARGRGRMLYRLEQNREKSGGGKGGGTVYVSSSLLLD